MVNRLFLILLTALAAVSCSHKELSEEDYCGTGDTPVKVVMNWDDPATQAREMRVNLFSQTSGVIDYGRDDVPVSGEKYVNLMGGADYRPFCYDYNASSIYFRNEMDMSRFEAYFSGMSRTTYDKYASPVDGEMTFSSPTNGEFYVDAWMSDFNVVANSPVEQVIDFYPKNILRQFTYRINNIIGQENISDACGAASGMASVFIFYTNSPSGERATMLFGNVTKGFDNDEGYGYLEGEFYTFGPKAPYNTRFTMEIYSTASKYYASYWDVSTQIAESMANRPAKLLRDGYDILIWNDPDNNIPEIDPGKGSGSGFEIGVGDWGKEVEIYL